MIKLADGRGLLYQWDTGRQVECDAEQVHFSNHHYGTSIDVDVKDGKATIPNQLLTSATPIKAWAWVKDSNGEYTKEEQIFLVAKRNKPSDYVYTPTEIKTWQDLQNQIGDLNNLTTVHKDNLVNAINDAAESGGGGASDFIIKMTVESNNDDGYTVTSCDATFEQVDAAVAAEKRVVVIASDGYAIFELPMIQGFEGNAYYFGIFFQGQTIAAFAQKAGENKSKWIFLMTQIEAESVDYSNAALPSVTNVKIALDALVPKSHTHANKDTLDKLSDSNGKLQYNGSDVGLKGADGANGITPTIGANGNWYLDTTDTGKPSRGETGARGDKGDTGADGADGKSAYQYAQEGGYTGTETEFAEKLASGALIVTITDNNGTLSADKTFLEIHDAYLAGTPVYVGYDGFAYPVIAAGADSIAFGTIECVNDDMGAVVGTNIIEITQYGEVNDLSDAVDIPKTLPNPNAITFTGAVTGSYDGSSPMSVNIPSAVTKDNVITALGYTPEAVSAQVSTGSNIALADNTEYRLADVTTLTLTYPTGDFECWMRLSFAASGDITVTLPTGTKYIGTAPNFKNGETWELSIKDGVVVAGKVA